MSRPKGTPKTGGKQKGYSAKHVLFSKSIKERLETAGVDVIAEYLNLLRTDDLTVAYRMKILETLLLYSEPQIKPREVLPPEATEPDPTEAASTGTLLDLLRQ